MFKKHFYNAVCCLLVLMILFSDAHMAAVFADNYTDYYYNTFDNGAADASDSGDESGAMDFSSGFYDAAYNGNMGFGTKDNAYAYWAVYTFAAPVGSGALEISFDIGRNGRDDVQDYICGVTFNSASSDPKYVVKIDTKDTPKSGIIAGPKNNLAGYWDNSVTAEYAYDKVYNIKLTADFDNDKIYTCVNRLLLSERTMPSGFTLGDIKFSFSDLAGYVDNMSIRSVPSPDIYYQNTFDGKTASAVNYSDINGSITYGGYIPSDYNGNPGIAAKETDWSVKSYYTFENAIETGKLDLSFDVSKKDRANVPQGSGILFNMQSGTPLYIMIIKENEIIGPCEELVRWCDSTVSAQYQNNELYHIRILADFDANRIFTYVNNTLLSERSMPADLVLRDITISLAMTAAYFDNLVIRRSFDCMTECYIESDKTGNIFFDNEPAVMRLTAINRSSVYAADMLYHVTVSDIDGNTVYEKDISEFLDTNERKSIEFTPTADLYGVYNVTAVDSAGKIFSTVLTRSVRCIVPNKHIGTCVHFYDEMHKSGDVSQLMDLISASGYGYTRSDWPGLDITENSQNGEFSSDFFEDNQKFRLYIDESREKGISPLVLITSLNGSYTDSDGGFVTTPEALGKMESYCAWLSAKFRGLADSFEIGNEIDTKLNDDGSKAPASDYVQILNAAYRGIKTGNPNATVVGFGGHAYTLAAPFIEEAMANMRENGLSCTDAAAIHPYHFEGIAPELGHPKLPITWPSQSTELQKLLESGGFGDIEKWATEVGYQSELTGLKQQASYWVRQMALDRGYSLYDKMFYFSFQDDKASFGVIRHWTPPDWKINSGYTAKPAYPATAFWNRTTAQADCGGITETDGVYRCSLNADGRNINVLWSINDGGDNAVITAGNNSLYVYDMYGNLKSTVSGGLLNLHIGGEPVYVIDFDCSVSCTVGGREVTDASSLSTGEDVDFSAYARPGAAFAVAAYKAGLISEIRISETDSTGYAAVSMTHGGDNISYKLYLLDNAENMQPLSKYRLID